MYNADHLVGDHPGCCAGQMIYTNENNIFHHLPWVYQHKAVNHGAGENVCNEDGNGFHEV
jgi:hypothetical protein